MADQCQLFDSSAPLPQPLRANPTPKRPRRPRLAARRTGTETVTATFSLAGDERTITLPTSAALKAELHAAIDAETERVWWLKEQIQAVAAESEALLGKRMKHFDRWDSLDVAYGADLVESICTGVCSAYNHTINRVTMGLADANYAQLRAVDGNKGWRSRADRNSWRSRRDPDVDLSPDDPNSWYGGAASLEQWRQRCHAELDVCFVDGCVDTVITALRELEPLAMNQVAHALLSSVLDIYNTNGATRDAIQNDLIAFQQRAANTCWSIRMNKDWLSGIGSRHSAVRTLDEAVRALRKAGQCGLTGFQSLIAVMETARSRTWNETLSAGDVISEGSATLIARVARVELRIASEDFYQMAAFIMCHLLERDSS